MTSIETFRKALVAELEKVVADHVTAVEIVQRLEAFIDAKIANARAAISKEHRQ